MEDRREMGEVLAATLFDTQIPFSVSVYVSLISILTIIEV